MLPEWCFLSSRGSERPKDLPKDNRPNISLIFTLPVFKMTSAESVVQSVEQRTVLLWLGRLKRRLPPASNLKGGSAFLVFPRAVKVLFLSLQEESSEPALGKQVGEVEAHTGARSMRGSGSLIQFWVWLYTFQSFVL